MPALRRWVTLLDRDLWRIRRKDVPAHRYFWLRQLRVLVLSLREFNRSKCTLHASALTFYTLLSIVPLLAMAFGVAKGFGLAEILEAAIRENMQGQDEVVNRVIAFSNNLLASARGGVVAGIGVAVLLWTIVKVLGNIESSFNDIWGVKEARSLWRKFSDYLAFMLIAPIVLIIASSMTVLVTSKVHALVARLELWGWAGSTIFALLKIIPLALLWGLFTFTYIFMPNTRVNWLSGLMGGIIAGTLYQVTQWIYIKFQIGVANYGAIYGSFAALPLFLIWMQTSWLIVLLGAEISFAHQHVDTYEFEPDCLRVSPSFKRTLTLRVVQYCVKRFDHGEPPPSADEISRELDTPIRLINQILHELVEARVLAEVRRAGERSAGYQPARNPDTLTVAGVLQMLDEHGVKDIPVADTPEWQKLTHAIRELESLQARAEVNLRLKDL
ncbi:MAG: YihY family inner membrane protein [Candidatus Sumerlaeia bacterium]|nr:YihY family inner membrane protein [Candidatus Sumerlaeia bacterium]